MRNKKEFAALADNIDKENNNGKGNKSQKPAGWKDGYLDLTPVARGKVKKRCNEFFVIGSLCI